jgi:hypothetical protein
MVYDFNIFGQMVIRAHDTPLVLSYTIGGRDDVAYLSANVVGDIWSDAFGVKGLRVSWLLRCESLQLNLHPIVARGCQLQYLIFCQGAIEIAPIRL